MLTHQRRSLRFAAALALLASSTALAQTPTGFPRAYLGLGLGFGNVSLPSSSGNIGATAVSTRSAKDNVLGTKLYAGYRADSTWGIELGYQDFGSKHEVVLDTPAGTARGTMKLSSFYAAATATASPTPSLSFFAKLGMARNFLAMSAVCVSPTCTASRGETSHRWTVAPGIGAEYLISRDWGARFDYDDYGKISAGDVLSTGNSGELRARAWSMSIKRNF